MTNTKQRSQDYYTTRASLRHNQMQSATNMMTISLMKFFMSQIQISKDYNNNILNCKICIKNCHQKLMRQHQLNTPMIEEPLNI